MSRNRAGVRQAAQVRQIGALEDDVFRLLHVDVARAKAIEHVRQHARPIAVAHHEHVRRGRLPGEVDDVRNFSGVLVAGDDPHRLRRNRFLHAHAVIEYVEQHLRDCSDDS